MRHLASLKPVHWLGLAVALAAVAAAGVAALWHSPSSANARLAAAIEVCVVAPPLAFDPQSGLALHAPRPVPVDARCPVCGNMRRPAVVWFGEHLPAAALESAEQAARACELMLVVGTSGEVYPAAGLALTAHQCGARVVMVNPEATPLDAVAELCLRESAVQCLPPLLS